MIRSQTEIELEKVFTTLSGLMSHQDSDASENIFEINNCKRRVLDILTKINDSRKD